MHTLEELQALGAIRDSLRSVSGEGTIPLSQALEMDDEAQADFDGSVVIDSPDWIATVSAMPVSETRHVYSANGDEVGIYDNQKRAFYTTILQDDRLVTTNILHLKEGHKMATELNLNEEDILAELDKAAKEDVGAGLQEAPNFGDQKEASKKDANAKKEETRKFNDGVRAKFAAASDKNVSAPENVIRNNRLNGRLYAFITGTNDTVKVSVKSTPKMGPDNKPIPVAGATEEVKKAIRDGKRVPAKELEKEYTIGFTNSKPSAPKGVIIGTPVGTDLPLTSIGDPKAQEQLCDLSKTDIAFHLMSMDAAYAYVAYNYGDQIKESKESIGPKAESLVFSRVITRSKKDPDDFKVRFAIKTEKPGTGLKARALIIDENYIPMKLYQTVSLQDPSADDKKAINLNFEAACATAKKKGVQLCENSQNMILSQDYENGFETKWADGAPIEVEKYDKTGLKKDVALPVRIKTEKAKEKGSFTYKFAYYDLDDEARGPLADPKCQHILEVCKFTAQEFKSLVAANLKKSSTPKASKGTHAAISYEEYLRGCIGKDEHVRTKDFSDLQRELDGLAM